MFTLVIVVVIITAINAVIVHVAAICANAEAADYKVTFATVFWLNIIAFLIGLFVGGGKMTPTAQTILNLAILTFCVYIFKEKLVIQGSKNTLIFIGMAFFLNILITFVLTMVLMTILR